MTNIDNIKKITVALCLPIMMACIDVMALSIALIAIVQEFLTPIYQTQWLFSVYMIANSAFLVVSGQLADAYGRRRLLLLGISGFTIASLIAACSFNFWLLVLARALQGLASAAIMTTSLALITHNFALTLRSQILTKWMFSIGLGLAFGPLIGGLLIYLFNWRMIFLINLPVGIIGYWLVKQFIVESKSDIYVQRSNLLNAFCLSVVILLLSLFLSQGDDWGWNSNLSLGVFIGFCFSLVLFLYLEVRKSYPTLCIEFYRKKSFIIGILSGFFSYFFMYSWLFLFGLYLQEVRGLSPLQASIICISYSIAFAFGPLCLSKYYPNLGENRFIKLGFIGATVAFIGMSYNPSSILLAAFVLTFFILGLSIATINVSSMAIATIDVPKDLSGSVSGVIFTVRWLGGAVGVVVATLIFHAISVCQLKKKLKGIGDLESKVLSKLVFSGHLVDINKQLKVHADLVVALAKNALTISLTYSCLILAGFAFLCFGIVSYLSARTRIVEN